MNSAIGNFNNNGEKLMSEQTPENVLVKNIRIPSDTLQYFIDTKQLAYRPLMDIYTPAENYNNLERKLQLQPDGTLKPLYSDVAYEGNNHFPVLPVVTNNVLNVLDYVSKDEWDHFEGLAMVMLANGATLFELQQRLMGLS